MKRGRRTVVVKELLYEVDVGKDHAATAVAFELKLVKRIARGIRRAVEKGS